MNGVRGRPVPGGKEERMCVCRDQRPCKEAFEERTISQVADVDTELGPHEPVTSASSGSQHREQASLLIVTSCAFLIHLAATNQDRQWPPLGGPPMPALHLALGTKRSWENRGTAPAFMGFIVSWGKKTKTKKKEKASNSLTHSLAEILNLSYIPGSI